MSNQTITLSGQAVAPAQVARTGLDWLARHALPYWADKGVCRKTGLFVERLALDGSDDAGAVHRSRVQARQIYVYAHAAVSGIYPAGREIALAGFDAYTAFARRDGKPGYLHTFMRDGRVVDGRRDTYDHAFMVLAFAWCWRATGEARVLAALHEVLGFIDTTLTLPDGSLREDDLDTLPRRQNPHMHMFEAMLALKETGAVPDAIARADRLLAVILKHFIDEPTGLLGEFFTQDLALEAGERGLLVEPGHMAEWAWLLGARLRHAPDQPAGFDVRALIGRMIERAHRTAEPATGFLIDEGDRNDRPVKTTRRMWPQTEQVKGLLSWHEHGGGPDALTRAAAAFERLQAHYFPERLSGGWLDQFDAEGTLLVSNMPSSSFYHIFVAIMEMARVAKI